MQSMQNDHRTRPGRRRTVSRRGFLRTAGVLGGAAALLGLGDYRIALAAEDFPGHAGRYGVLTDITKCIGCRLCEMACAQANRLAEPPAGTSVYKQPRHPSDQAFTVVNRYLDPASGEKIYRKEQCLHCDEPACVSACLVKALRKTTEGPVVYDENLCMGCRYCLVACPFSIPAYEYFNASSPRVRKCNMCYERVRQQGGITACAEVCPTQATIFGQRSELLEIARERIAREPDKYANHIYGEHEAGGTGWLYLSAAPAESVGLPTEVGKTPYPEYTRDLLLAIPAAYVTIPPILAGLYAIMKRRAQAVDEDGGEGNDAEVQE